MKLCSRPEDQSLITRTVAGELRTMVQEGGKDSGKKHTDRRITPRLVIVKALGVVPMAPAFGWD
jgi:hypothetical protein